jgi:hypothetical protein
MAYRRDAKIPASMELKVLRLSKGASGIEVRWIDGLGKLPFHPNT